MGSGTTRFRGAQPFEDDPISQRTFFGRNAESTALANQILANRLVVVYAKSGLGKTSLLKAGVAPKLREAGCQPLMVRLNDLRLGPIGSLFASISSEARRQGVEWKPGDETSCWTYFKTVEFWRGDELLTPVVIIDQFEELFTLHEVGDRERFINDLGPLTRGSRVWSGSNPDSAPNESCGPLHIVLSLREEFLGMLDDAADRIPSILDHRFRLMPLSRGSAEAAMAGPASLIDNRFNSRPFRLTPSFTEEILNYLTMQLPGGSGHSTKSVEPFHLQLICQRVEKLVSDRTDQRFGTRDFDLTAFGGAEALPATLTAFYSRAVESLSQSHLRKAARRLCEDYLISPEGRRLSIEEMEIRKQLKLSDLSLRQLVESRLLRTDRRSDRTYYEISHDTLVEPILATRRVRALFLGWLAIVAGWLAIGVCSLAIISALTGLAAIVTEREEPMPLEFGVGFLLGILLLLVLFNASVKVVKSGFRTYRRFKWRRRGETIVISTDFVPWPKRFAARAIQGLGASMAAFAGLAGLFLVLVFVAYVTFFGDRPEWVLESWASTLFDAEMFAHPIATFGLGTITTLVLYLSGMMLWRAARRMLAPGEIRVSAPPSGATSSRFLDVARKTWFHTACHTLVLLIGLVYAYVVLECGTGASALPSWIPKLLTTVSDQKGCVELSERDLGIGAVDLVLNALLMLGYGATQLWLNSSSLFRGGRLTSIRR